jgi:hypothetical protein
MISNNKNFESCPDCEFRSGASVCWSGYGNFLHLGAYKGNAAATFYVSALMLALMFIFIVQFWRERRMQQTSALQGTLLTSLLYLYILFVILTGALWYIAFVFPVVVLASYQCCGSRSGSGSFFEPPDLDPDPSLFARIRIWMPIRILLLSRKIKGRKI